MRSPRPVLAVAATAMLPVVTVLAVSLTGPAQALPTTTLADIIDVPDAADTFRARFGPARNTLAVSWSIPESSGSQGHREVWLQVRRNGAWSAPTMVSDPAVDSWEPQIAVDSGGTVEVAWREDLATDRLVVRAAGAGGLGERRVIDAAPSEGFRLANGPERTVVVWDRYDASSNLEVHAAIDSGSGFGASSPVSDTSSTSDFFAADVSADAGIHVAMTRQAFSAIGYTYSTTWAVRNADGTWTRKELSQSLTRTTRLDAHVAVEQGTGDAAILHHYIDSGGNGSRYATGWNADPAVVAAPQDRLTAPTDLGPGNGLAHRDALSVSGTLVGVLGDGVATLTVGNGTTSASTVTPTSAPCAGGAFALRDDLSFVCLTPSDPAGAWVDVSLDASSTVLGRVTPGAGATKVSASPVDVTTPVFLLTEVRSPSPVARSLLVLAPSGTTPTPPTSPSPSSPTPTSPTPSGPVPVAPAPATPTSTSFVRVSSPTVSGRLRVGATLRARPGSWTPAPITVRYQWLANGTKIRKATTARLRLASKLRTRKIAVRITLVRAGTETKVVTVKRSGRVR